mgnify:FL=1
MERFQVRRIQVVGIDLSSFKKPFGRRGPQRLVDKTFVVTPPSVLAHTVSPTYKTAVHHFLSLTNLFRIIQR